MVPYDDALAIVLRQTAPLGTEALSLDDALGRVLGEDVRADADMPGFDRAAMDGYALCVEDVARAPVRLAIVGELRAGEWPSRRVGPGEAFRIMTGAPVPEGATAVEPVEKTRLRGDTVEILTAVEAGAHVARRGSSARKGEVLFARGRTIDAAALGVLASVGRVRPSVGLRPRLALLATGDELVDAGEAPAPGQIRNSNLPALAAQARLAGASVHALGIVPDRLDAIVAALGEARDADLLVVSGGVSAGDYDFVEPALEQCGFSFLFTSVAVKPGAPLVFGRREKTLVFGLPGNPVSAQVTFELFVRPCLRRMQGAREAVRPRCTVRLASDVHNRSGRAAYLPARLHGHDGRLVARLVPSAGSGDLVAHARADALVVIEPLRTEAKAGEDAEAVLLERFLEGDSGEL